MHRTQNTYTCRAIDPTTGKPLATRYYYGTQTKAIRYFSKMAVFKTLPNTAKITIIPDHLDLTYHILTRKKVC